jgi:hypothetical protein
MDGRAFVADMYGLKHYASIAGVPAFAVILAQALEAEIRFGIVGHQLRNGFRRSSSPRGWARLGMTRKLLRPATRCPEEQALRSGHACSESPRR